MSEKKGLFGRLKESLSKTKQGFVEKVETLLKSQGKIDEELFEELEEILIQGDVGVKTSLELIEALRQEVKLQKLNQPEQLLEVLKDKTKQLLELERAEPNFSDQSPTVVLVVGVNGVGKTTSIGKLAYKFKNEGKKVILAAGDTFRAAAIEQLEVWSNRVGIDLIKHHSGADPAAVVFDAVQAAKARKTDVLIIDTAGRLHTKVNLMEEMKKIERVIGREIPGAPHEVLLVLDATTGQNGLAQAKTFTEAVGVTGLVLSKLDGTAKGGIAIAIGNELKIPVKYIGLGEKIDDLKEFEPTEFIEALFA
jgi:fused signal recognition particle receptor